MFSYFLVLGYRLSGLADSFNFMYTVDLFESRFDWFTVTNYLSFYILHAAYVPLLKVLQRLNFLSEVYH